MTAAADWFQKRDAQRRRWAETARARYRRTSQISRVYRYEFPDGKVYVGVTRMSLKARERAHRRDMSVVGRRLECFPEEEPLLAVLGEFFDRGEAERFEAAVIRGLPAEVRLNKVLPKAGVVAMTPVEDWERRVAEGYEAAPRQTRSGVE